MHELSICEALLTHVTDIVQQQQADYASDITVQVGALSGVEADLLERAFSVARIGTVAENAQLHIETLAIKIKCKKCNAETEAAVNRLLCGECGHWHTRVIAGEELLLRQVEVHQHSSSSFSSSKCE